MMSLHFYARKVAKFYALKVKSRKLPILKEVCGFSVDSLVSSAPLPTLSLLPVPLD